MDRKDQWIKQQDSVAAISMSIGPSDGRGLDPSGHGGSPHKVQGVNKSSASGGKGQVPPLQGKFYAVWIVTSSLRSAPKSEFGSASGVFDGS